MKLDHTKILLHDDDCNLCNRSIKIVSKYNSKNDIKLVPLKSNYAQDIANKYHINIQEINSSIFIQSDITYIKSDCILKVISHLDKPIKYLYVLRFIPKGIRDWVYDIVASNRR